jgi:hypothetical protein
MISTGVTVLGVAAIVLQIGNYLETKSGENRKKQEELISKLYFADIDLNKMLMEHPQLQRTMYDDPQGDSFNALNESEKLKCYSVCQMYGDLLEYYTMLESNLKSSDEDAKQMFYCWEHYVQYFWDNSFAFRQYMVITKNTWTPRFLAKFPKEDFAKLVKDREMNRNKPTKSGG